MVKEVSTKLLIALIAIAIVVSFGGTYMSLSRLNRFVMPQITGALIDPGIGYANYSIAQTTSIAVSQNIEFGDGYVNTSIFGEMEGNHSNQVCTEGRGTWGWSARGIQYIRIINDGNVNVSINVTSNNTPAEFIGGAAGDGPWRNISITYEEDSGAITNGACFGTIDLRQYRNVTSTTNLTICSNLSFFDADDAINVSVRLIIPEDAPLGYKSTLLTFYAEKTPS